mmetsp:Transcript_19292/g.43937  ORF Transcript_19292/g.43937 Transcript_19292/m.43937 type:complete len:168 (-) Transcript_19292:59-562(-)
MSNNLTERRRNLYTRASIDIGQYYTEKQRLDACLGASGSPSSKQPRRKKKSAYLRERYGQNTKYNVGSLIISGLLIAFCCVRYWFGSKVKTGKTDVTIKMNLEENLRASAARVRRNRHDITLMRNDSLMDEIKTENENIYKRAEQDRDRQRKKVKINQGKLKTKGGQ